jgi:nucleoside-diphosphate-sugar epimerase
VLVTGLSGNLGQHLAPLLKDYPLVGVDLYRPRVDHPQVEFCQLDLSQPDAPEALEALLRESGTRWVVHLAFVLDPTRTSAFDRQRQWEINVRGTGYLLDAIESINRGQRQVEFFLYLSSVTSYGPMLPRPVDEDFPQQPHTYTYALHKKETEDVCRARHPRLGGCAIYIVRGHIVLGPRVDNFIVRSLQGRPGRRTLLGRWVERRRWKLPLLLPRGPQYDGLYQFMHVEDAARLMAWLCRHYEPGKLLILNAQGRGAPLRAADIGRIGRVPVWRLPSYKFVGLLYRLFWWLGVSPVPPEAYPYFAGSYVMNTERLERLLGAEYGEIVRHTSEEAMRSIVEP